MPTTYLYVVSGRRIVLTGCRGQRRLSPAATWWMVVRNIFSHLTTGPSPYASSSDDDDDTLSEPQFPESSSPELLLDERLPSSMEPLDELPPSKDDPREISPPNGQPTADMVRLRCGPAGCSGGLVRWCRLVIGRDRSVVYGCAGRTWECECGRCDGTHAEVVAFLLGRGRGVRTHVPGNVTPAKHAHVAITRVPERPAVAPCLRNKRL